MSHPNLTRNIEEHLGRQAVGERGAQAYHDGKRREGLQLNPKGNAACGMPPVLIGNSY